VISEQTADDSPPIYEVQEGERAEGDRDAIFLRLTPIIGPERANDIDIGLRTAIADLSEFPGPKANAVDIDASETFGIEVRRAFYRGPAGRRLSTPYRIFYTIIEADAEHPIGIIRVLRVLHGSQELNPNAGSR